MDTIMLSSVFLSTLVISGSVVLIFSPLIDGVLFRLITGEMAAAWSLFAKFALLVAALTGGLRLSDIGSLISAAQGGGAPASLSSGKILLEVFRAVLGTLNGSVWMLLLIFGAGLVCTVAQKLYARVSNEQASDGGPESNSSVGAGRHSRVREPSESQ
jgi:hypothetical protein